MHGGCEGGAQLLFLRKQMFARRVQLISDDRPSLLSDESPSCSLVPCLEFLLACVGTQESHTFMSTTLEPTQDVPAFCFIVHSFLSNKNS